MIPVVYVVENSYLCNDELVSDFRHKNYKHIVKS